MKKLILLATLLAASLSSAQTLSTRSGQTLKGTELINEHPTGRSCYVVVQQVYNQFSKGHHCYGIEAQFAFNNDAVSKDPIVLGSKVTNYHRSEYPAVKSCAETVDGKVSGAEIYQSQTDNLYTPFFSADKKVGSTQYDYFLTMDPVTKAPTRARVHVLKMFSETNYDCVNLSSGQQQKTIKHGGGHHDPAPVPGSKPEGCDFWFANHGLCGRITFLTKPLVNQDSPFQILFTDLDLNPVDHPPVYADLWMNMEGGHHGHGSAPVTTTRLTNGVYRSENVFFLMPGLWQVRVTIGHGTHHAETDIYDINITK